MNINTAIPFAAFSLATLSYSCTGNQKQQEPEKPNIIVFLVDDMGLMDTQVPFLTDGVRDSLFHPSGTRPGYPSTPYHPPGIQ